MKKRTKIIIKISAIFLIVAILAALSVVVISIFKDQQKLIANLEEENDNLRHQVKEKEETTVEETTENNDPYLFYSVSDLLIAVKKNPDFYKGQTVRVYGYFKDIELSSGYYEAVLYSENPYSTIEIYVESGSRYLLDDGDYIRANAVVSINGNTIRLVNMKYALIETAIEREQNGG